MVRKQQVVNGLIVMLILPLIVATGLELGSRFVISLGASQSESTTVDRSLKGDLLISPKQQLKRFGVKEYAV